MKCLNTSTDILPQQLKNVKNNEKVLEGMKTVQSELKKLGNKGKETIKKTFDELISKHVYKVDHKWSQDKRMEDYDSILFDYMMKSGAIKFPPNGKGLNDILGNIQNPELKKEEDSVKEKVNTK